MAQILSLEDAAKSGNIDRLYELIKEDPYVLAKIDNVPFIDTPLHVAAAEGKTEFAMEIMHWMTSFARKPNADGDTPLHLAVGNGHLWLVFELVKVDPSLVRLQGREGMTPLLSAVNGNKIDIVSEFFLVCHESIVDVNVNGENALHIALKNKDQRDGLILLKVLMGWIRRLCQKDAELIETRVLNRRDKDGNTPLHIAAYNYNQQAMISMLKGSTVNINVENKEGLTVLDVAKLNSRDKNTRVMERLVKKHGGKRSASLAKIKTTSYMLGSKPTWYESRRTRMIRSYSWISESRRNALLVVATLIITTTYQTVLQPPGGVSDGGKSDGESGGQMVVGFVSPPPPPPQKAGSVVMDGEYFGWLWMSNTAGFYLATALTLRLLSLGQESMFWYYPLFVPLLVAYFIAGLVISRDAFEFALSCIFAVIILMIWSFVVWFWDWVKSMFTKNSGPKSGLVWEGFTTFDQARGVVATGKVIK